MGELITSFKLYSVCELTESGPWRLRSFDGVVVLRLVVNWVFCVSAMEGMELLSVGMVSHTLEVQGLVRGHAVVQGGALRL